PPPPLYAPPPPPKLDDEPSASAVAKQPAPKGSGTGAVATGPCGGKCEGGSTAALQTKLNELRQSTQGCYQRTLRPATEAGGRITVSVQISATGSVCSASLTNDEVHSGELASCVLGRFRTAAFPPPSGGCITAVVPINFSPKQ